jgi:hypothetical protein
VDNQNGDEFCVDMIRNETESFTWRDEACNKTKKFICQTPADKHIYKTSQKAGNWIKAVVTCEKWGGHLVNISSYVEETLINKQIDSNQSYWIGLTTNMSPLKWQDGSLVPYMNFQFNGKMGCFTL